MPKIKSNMIAVIKVGIAIPSDAIAVTIRSAKLRGHVAPIIAKVKAKITATISAVKVNSTVGIRFPPIMLRTFSPLK
jgi:hypothetical protein